MKINFFAIAIPKVWLPPKKTLLVMKLTTLLLTIVLLQASAKTYSQVSLNVKNAPLENVLNTIKQQSGYVFLYDGDLLTDKTVTVKLNNVSLNTALEECLKNLPLTYKIVQKNVVIQKLEPSLINKVKDFFVVPIDIHGRVVDDKGIGLPGAAIKVKDGRGIAVTDAEGYFEFKAVDENATLIITYIGFQAQEIKAKKELGEVKMVASLSQLTEVGIVSTGYQSLPKERATGSFVLVDSTLLNRSVGANILDRLDGVTSGVLFNRTKSVANTPDISIRGRSTISSNPSPLIILDNFPYDGDISNINPQDVKSITILKDAAAASIWGSRAGNGVIVITTYKGSFNQKPVVSFNANVTVGGKPDVFYLPQLTNKQFIGVEQTLFDNGAYDNTINNGYGALSPAVEIMLLNRNGQINAQRKAFMLDSISNHDNRNDLNKYYYRNSVAQQYQLAIRGGGQNNKYSISMGYDKNLANVVTTSNDRLTLNANNTISFLNNKLELSTGVLFSTSKSNLNSSNYQPQTPYENIADPNGNPLAVAKTLRLPYVDTAGNGHLLDWHYRPLAELQNPYSTNNNRLTDYRVTVGLNYKIMTGLNFGVSYAYDKGINDQQNYNTLDSYYTRNLINQYSQINPTTGVVTYPLPLGDIVSNSTNSYYSHYGRGQLSYDKSFNKHAINAIAGFEVKDYENAFSSVGLYGYNKDTQTNLNSSINTTALYNSYYGFNSSRIDPNINSAGSIDRYRSYFINGAYTYDNRFIVSGSARKDESNLFGVKTNQKGVPLWSGGFAWNLSNESFYHFEALPYLKLRATYGYNGNVNKSVSAYVTAQTLGINLWQIPYLNIINPPNPSLRWEQVRNLNIGFDFQSKNNIISGSIEYWIKDGLDLIGQSPIAQQTGVSLFTGNTANMRGKGVDLVLNSQNLKLANFKWTSNFQFNYNTDKITSYKVKNQNNSTIISQLYLQPLVGYSYYSLFSYKWMGLDNQGDPQSLLNGSKSKDYDSMLFSSNNSDLVYSGTLTPKYFGNLLNTITWKSMELSVNLVYKFGYVYRRHSLEGYNLYNASSTGISQYGQADYDLRWQKAGDELITNVPALNYPSDGSREEIYANSDILVEKADNIRLQDIRLNYSLSKKTIKNLPFSNINIYTYISNLGVIWRASKYKIDPDYPTSIPLPKMFSVGLKADF